MIKVGIYGPAGIDSPLRKQLLRLLLRHTDVDLRSVACPQANGEAIAELHPVYTGETDLRIERQPELDGLDVLFVIDEENLMPAMTEKLRDDADFRLIVLGEAPQLRKGSPDFVYGFAEHNRKALVRGARAAVSPSAAALLIETALFPLAKSWRLPDTAIEGRMAVPEKVAIDCDEASAELRSVQTSFAGTIEVRRDAEVPYERMDLTLRLPLTDSIEEVRKAYETAYEDHSFVHLIPGRNGVDEDLRGSNKVLLQIYRDGDALSINASADNLTRGNAGNSVHLMNLLFGLHERTGLSI